MKRTKKTRTNRKTLQKRLHELERRLTEELHEHLGNLQNISTSRPSELLDIVSDGELDFMSAMSVEAGSATIAEIRQALGKLRRGTYGVCNACGKAIAARRLKARPFAILCLPCKEKEERRGYASSVGPMPVRSGSVAVSLTDDDPQEMGDAGVDLLRDIEDLEVNEMF